MDLFSLDWKRKVNSLRERAPTIFSTRFLILLCLLLSC